MKAKALHAELGYGNREQGDYEVVAVLNFGQGIDEVRMHLSDTALWNLDRKQLVLMVADEEPSKEAEHEEEKYEESKYLGYEE